MILHALTHAALRQRLVTLGATLALAVAGLLAWRALPVDAFPDVSSPQVKVIMKAPGMTPEEVETRVVLPIEQEVLGIARKRTVRSISKYGIADVTVDFEEGTDVYWARQQVAEALANVRADLPASAQGGLAPITTPLSDVFMFTVEGPASLAQKRSALQWQLRPALRTVPGVADVNMLGGDQRVFEVVPDPARMAAQGVGLEALRAALSTNNSNDGAGRLDEGEETRIVRVQGAFRDAADIRDTVIAARGAGGGVVRVGDVAEVRMASSTRYGIVTEDGKGEAVEGIVLALRGANASKVIAGVRARLAEVEPRLPQGMKLRVFYDRSQLVGRAVGTVMRALAEAVVLVVVMLLAFLGNWRAALVVAVTLPLSALATFVLMRWAGLSANLMSLGGLAIALGMLVDAAVVVVENLVNHMSHDPARASAGDAGAATSDRLARVLRAVSEVAGPVLSGVAIIGIVFLPLLSLQGLEGKLFRPVALTIVFALAASLLIALTTVPVLASMLLRHTAHADPWLVRKLSAGYARVLDWSFAHARTVVVLALVSLLAAGFAYTRVGKTFMPTLDEGDIILQLQKLPSVGLGATAALDLRVQRALLQQVPEIRAIIARSGSDDLGLDPMGLNETDTFLVLKPASEWRGDKTQVIEAIRKVMQRFPGVDYTFTQPIEMRVSEMLTGSRGDLVVKIFGPDLQQLGVLAQQVAQVLRGLPGAQEVLAARTEGVQYLTVDVDRLAAGRAGFDVETLQRDLRALVEGQQLGVVLEGVRRTPLLLRGDAQLREQPQGFADLRITGPDGRSWPLSYLARLRPTLGPVLVTHEDGSRFATVQANVGGRDLVGFVDEARRAVAARVKLPEGVRLQWGGQFENQQRAAARLGLVVPLALGLIFVLLMTTFGSLRQSVLVFANIPFALVGGVLALWLSGEYMSVPASVGFIALLGIAVLNGVVLVSHFNELLQRGLPLARAVREGSMRRLRPVMMTAGITALGLIPLLSASGPGSEIQKPLAVVVVGGLLSSTVLTLVLLPLLFARFGLPAIARDAAATPPEDSA
ncbi:MAG: efflux RND transporter permease subunit [Betaproteobacteria bacterium]|nr:CusA/CzcA family heavy metal efflux RND transporter [Betaproteobacteria bacterium]MDE1954997.1 efflux RND transporter permease subunit [Betaproteobacteria bacterium]MDE2151101.1 efflux RND transporter permease subunit [Betaproteobacteria bacterium]